MFQVTGFITLLAISVLMYMKYLRDRERFRIYKKVAIYELLLAILSLVLIFTD